MTVGAQKSEIALVRFPILEAAPPCPACLGFDFRLGIYVVNIQGAGVVVAAFHTFSPKIIYQSQPSCPIPRVFVCLGAALVPILLTARGATKSLLVTPTSIAAISTLPSIAPAGSQITGATSDRDWETP